MCWKYFYFDHLYPNYVQYGALSLRQTENRMADTCLSLLPSRTSFPLTFARLCTPLPPSPFPSAQLSSIEHSAGQGTPYSTSPEVSPIPGVTVCDVLAMFLRHVVYVPVCTFTERATGTCQSQGKQRTGRQAGAVKGTSDKQGGEDVSQGQETVGYQSQETRTF